MNNKIKTLILDVIIIIIFWIICKLIKPDLISFCLGASYAIALVIIERIFGKKNE